MVPVCRGSKALWWCWERSGVQSSAVGAAVGSGGKLESVKFSEAVLWRIFKGVPKALWRGRKKASTATCFLQFFLIMKAGLLFSFYSEEQSQGSCDSAYTESSPSMSIGGRFCCIALSDALYRWKSIGNSVFTQFITVVVFFLILGECCLCKWTSFLEIEFLSVPLLFMIAAVPSHLWFYEQSAACKEWR